MDDNQTVLFEVEPVLSPPPRLEGDWYIVVGRYRKDDHPHLILSDIVATKYLLTKEQAKRVAQKALARGWYAVWIGKIVEKKP